MVLILAKKCFFICPVLLIDICLLIKCSCTDSFYSHSRRVAHTPMNWQAASTKINQLLRNISVDDVSNLNYPGKNYNMIFWHILSALPCLHLLWTIEHLRNEWNFCFNPTHTFLQWIKNILQTDDNWDFAQG